MARLKDSFVYVKEKSSKHFQNVLKIKASPHSIGLGFAIGSFISILPTPGFSFLVALLLIFLFKGINKFALFAGLLFWNPLVSLPIYYLSYKIGDLLFQNVPVLIYELSLFDQIFIFARRYLIGNFILAITCSTLSYLIIKAIFKKFRKD